MPGDLHYGDNLDVLRHKVASESVDLIYLDPPFNSDRTYNLLHKGSEAQQAAFFDTWHWDDRAARAFAELTDHAPTGVVVPKALSDLMGSLKNFLWEHQRDTLAYLSMMAIRLIEMRRVLRRTGSLYLHCDPTASHYLKIILDGIFGPQNFRSEIVWKRSHAHNSAKRYGPIHDTLLFYSRGEDITWNPAFHGYDTEYLDKHYKHVEADGRRYKRENPTGAGTRNGETGKPWRGIDPTPKGRHWAKTPAEMDELDAAGLIYWPSKPGAWPYLKLFLNDVKGVPLQDIWTDIDPINMIARERTGYPTQKPLPLLERIINASSNRGDVVLDPFCGCGTTVEAAEKLGRKWIGIDLAIRAIDVIKDRLDQKFQPRVWKEFGEPSDVEGAEHLADTNPYDFQWWAVRKLGGQPPKGEKKKGGDGGIDGELKLRDFGSGSSRRVIVSVKGGRNLTPEMVRGLDSTVRLEKADMGIFLTMHSPSANMRTIARECGTLSWANRDGKIEQRIRIITIPEVLAGTVQLPGINVTPRSASTPPPPEPRKGETLNLPFPSAGKLQARAKAATRPSERTAIASVAKSAREIDREQAARKAVRKRRRG